MITLNEKTDYLVFWVAKTMQPSRFGNNNVIARFAGFPTREAAEKQVARLKKCEETGAPYCQRYVSHVVTNY